MRQPPAFSGAGLDRADLLRTDPIGLAALARQSDARVLALAGLDPVADAAGRLEWTQLGDMALDALIFLGVDDGAPRFAPLVETPPVGERPMHLFRLLAELDGRDAAIWGAARSLNEWHNRNRFCGMCGARSRSLRAGWARRCTGCDAEHFPRVDPVVIMLAEYEDRVLIGRQPRFPPRRYSALAGFVEPGESVEEAVARELNEEAGVAITAVRYVSSQPWPFPHQLMIGCIADAASDAIKLDQNEIEHAIWVDRTQVAAALSGDHSAPFQAPPPYAIARNLLSEWVEG